MAEQFLTPGLWDRDRVQQTLEHAGETVTVRTLERRIEGLPFLPPIVPAIGEARPKRQVNLLSARLR